MGPRILPLALLALAACSPSTPPLPNAGPPPAAPPAAAPVLATTPTPDGRLPVPFTAKRPVVDAYHGVKVTDDYRWLETWDSDEVKRWTEQQTRHARSVLDGLPAAAAIRARLTTLKGSQSAEHYRLQQRGGVLFALRQDPAKQQAVLITLRSADDPASARTVVDPNSIDAKGGTTIDFYVPSFDGKLVAVSLSQGGSEDGTVHVYDVATGKALPDVIPRVNGGTAGGDVEWNAKGTGFWYTRYPRGAERPQADMAFYQQVWFHELGKKTDDDRYVLGKELPRIALIQLATSADGRYLLASVANGDGGEYGHWLLGPSGKWTEVTRFADQVTAAVFGRGDDHLYLVSHKGAPRGKVLRLPLAKPELATAETIVPESQATIASIAPTKTRLYVRELLGGPSQIRVLAKDGSGAALVPLPPVSAIRELTRLEGDEVLFRTERYVEPSAWYHTDGSGSAARRTALFTTSPADFGDSEVVRETCKSKDGTAVPINIVRLKGTRKDGSNPTLLTGYGGYNVSLQPRFNEELRVWLEQGGVFAVANLRGGGEFGEAWHAAGKLTNKQNVFDDFTACAEHLIRTGYTSRQKLAVIGGSNGGLLMGALVTQHPDLVKAVVSRVGIYDMLRVELHPNGAFNVTEFGTVKDRAQFEALHAYSPYHHVIDGTAYPAILMTTGVNDPRVDPHQSRKMAARLQAATASRAPVLLVTKLDGGHGIGSSTTEEIELAVDTYAFLFEQLGVPYRPR